MVCQHRQGWSKVRVLSFHPDPGFFMRSFHLVRTFIVPKFRFLSVGLAALTLAACEVQPVVTAPATPETTATPAVTVPETTTPETTSDASSVSVQDTAPEVTAEAETEAVAEAAPDPTPDQTPEQAPEPNTEVGPEQPGAADDTAGENGAGDVVVTEDVASDVVTGDAAGSDTASSDTTSDTAAEEQAVTELALAAPPPPPPPPPAELEPASLVGVLPDRLRARLGDADFARQEGNMKTWQYRFASCVVDYFLFPEEGVTRVAGWSWRAPVIGMEVDSTACRQAMARRDSMGN